jgi:hypothetical protein
MSTVSAGSAGSDTASVRSDTSSASSTSTAATTPPSSPILSPKVAFAGSDVSHGIDSTASTAALTPPSSSWLSSKVANSNASVDRDSNIEENRNPARLFWLDLVTEQARTAKKDEIEGMVGEFARLRTKSAPGSKMPRHYDQHTEEDRMKMHEDKFCEMVEKTAQMMSKYPEGFHDTDNDGPAPGKKVGYGGMMFEALGSQYITNDLTCRFAEGSEQEGTPHTGTKAYHHPEFSSSAAKQYFPALLPMAATISCAPDTEGEFDEFATHFPDSMQTFLKTARPMIRDKYVVPWATGTGKTFTHRFADGTEREIKSAMRPVPKEFPLFGLEPSERVTSILNYHANSSKRNTTTEFTASTSGPNSSLQRERRRRQAVRSLPGSGYATSATASSNAAPRSPPRSQVTTQAPDTTQASTVAESSEAEESSVDEAPTNRRGPPRKTPTAADQSRQNEEIARLFGNGKGTTTAAQRTCAPSTQAESRVSFAQAT